jgi:hypothetical protein
MADDLANALGKAFPSATSIKRTWAIPDVDGETVPDNVIIALRDVLVRGGGRGVVYFEKVSGGYEIKSYISGSGDNI